MRIFYDNETKEYVGATTLPSSQHPTPDNCGETTNMCLDYQGKVYDADSGAWVVKKRQGESQQDPSQDS